MERPHFQRAEDVQNNDRSPTVPSYLSMLSKTVVSPSVLEFTHSLFSKSERLDG